MRRRWADWTINGQGQRHHRDAPVEQGVFRGVAKTPHNLMPDRLAGYKHTSDMLVVYLPRKKDARAG